MFGAELWWKGDYATGTQGQAEKIQQLIKQEAQATMGCIWTTNLGAISMESGHRAATEQLENRQQRFELQLLSLPQGDQAWQVVGAPTEFGRQLTNALAHSGPTESTVLLEKPETLEAELLQEEEAEAKAEAERNRPGLFIFTDSLRLDNGATGYSVVWKRGLTWAGAKVHMGNNQEAYDAECAALAHALELAAQRSSTPERVTIFSDVQVAIRRMASDEPCPGQQYALQVRKHITRLRSARRGIVTEIRWCPAHKEVIGNEKADEWAKIAAAQPNTHGVEWLNSSGQMQVWAAPLPRSLANLKWEISEKKWAEA